MGTVIKSCYATAEVPASYISMAALAATRCMEQTDVPLREIDMLINIGVFRDDNIIEPAIAPLIQQELGLNLDPVKNGHLQHSTLAFDINDGENGFLTAACIADSFFKTGSAKHALIVAGDVHPSMTDHPDFPFQPVASAVLLAHSKEEQQGFAGFHFKTSPNGCHGFAASVDLSRSRTGNRHRLDFDMSENYTERILKFTSEMMTDLFAQGRLDAADVDFLVTSQSFSDFGSQVARAILLPARVRTVDLNGLYGNTHTSALPAGYQHLASAGGLQRNARLLFVAAGAGLSAACALYTV